MAGEGKGKGEKFVEGVDHATELIGTLVPTVAAIGGIVRLLATAFRPTDAQKAQEFDAAIAVLDGSLDKLDVAVSGFEAAKAEAAAKNAAKAGGNPVSAMGAKTTPSNG